MTARREAPGRDGGRSAAERRVAELRAQIENDLEALRAAWDRGRTWPQDLSRSPVAQWAQLLRTIPAWAAGILAGVLASILMARRGSTSGGRGDASQSL